MITADKRLKVVEELMNKTTIRFNKVAPIAPIFIPKDRLFKIVHFPT